MLLSVSLTSVVKMTKCFTNLGSALDLNLPALTSSYSCSEKQSGLQRNTKKLRLANTKKRKKKSVKMNQNF